METEIAHLSFVSRPQSNSLLHARRSRNRDNEEKKCRNKLRFKRDKNNSKHSIRTQHLDRQRLINNERRS